MLDFEGDLILLPCSAALLLLHRCLLLLDCQDDVLDFEGDLKSLGKAPGSDLREVLAERLVKQQ